MAEAILKGVLAAKLAGSQEISVGEPVAGRRDLLVKEYGVAATENNLEACWAAAPTPTDSIWNPQESKPIIREPLW